MAEFPAMPLWTDAYLADTGHLSYEEHGYYLMILMYMWRNPGCRFPADDGWLQRKFRLCEADFDNLLKPLLKEFCQCDGNWWTQKKLQKVWREVQERSSKQSDRANARWNKEKGRSRGNAAPAMQRLQCNQNQNTDSKTPPSLTQTTSATESPPQGGNGSTKPKYADRGTRLKDDWEPSEDAIAYCRNDLGCPAEIMNREYPSFMDWGLSATGPVSYKRNWDRAFINWIRRVMNDVREKEARERRWAEQRRSH